MPASANAEAAQVRPLPIRFSRAERDSRPAQYTAVARKNSVHIHMNEDWLENRYFRPKLSPARARLWSYSSMASSDMAPASGKNQRQLPQNQPSATTPAPLPNRIRSS